MRRIVVGIAGVAIIGAALGVAALTLRFRPLAEREDPRTVEREIVRLTHLRDSLRAEVYAASLASDLLDGRPAGDIVIGLPTPFVTAVVGDIAAGWFNDVELRLPPMHVRKIGQVKARMGIFGRRTVGEYGLDIDLRNVRGRLQPDTPVLGFGGDKITIALPVRVVGGTGVARITADWKSRGLAGPVCGAMRAQHDVTGTVRARTYMARGHIVLSASGGAVVADPDFPALAIRLFIDPSVRSVAALDSVLAARGGLCGWAIRKSEASRRLQEQVERGFRVTIPQRFFRPVVLPVSIGTSLTVQGDRGLSLQVTPSGIAVTASTVWLAATVRTAPARIGN